MGTTVVAASVGNALERASARPALLAVAHVQLFPKSLNLGRYVLTFGVVAGCVALCLIVVGTVLHRRMNRSDIGKAGLWGVTGPMGSGKTYLLAAMVCRAVKEGRPVFSNFPVEGAELVQSWAEVICVPDASLVVLAELHLWAPVDVKFLPPGLDQWVSQLRHHGITCVWDSQYWTAVSFKFRKLTFGVWEAKRLAGGHEYNLFQGYNYGRVKTARLSRMRLRRDKAVQGSYDTLCDVHSHTEWVTEVVAQRRGRRGGRPAWQ